MAKDYTNTLNLPKTDFPMRANLPQREPEMLGYWEEQDLYNELLKNAEGKKPFVLHDGPPFSNGNLHMGHAFHFRPYQLHERLLLFFQYVLGIYLLNLHQEMLLQLIQVSQQEQNFVLMML